MIYSYLTDELVWALIREREDEARSIRPHTERWPRSERAMVPPNPLRYWLSLALKRGERKPSPPLARHQRLGPGAGRRHRPDRGSPGRRADDRNRIHKQSGVEARRRASTAGAWAAADERDCDRAL